MDGWVQIVVGIAAVVTAVGIIFSKAILPGARFVSLLDEVLPVIQGDEDATPPIPPLRDRLSAMERRSEDAYREAAAAYHEARAAKESSVAVLTALRRKGLEL